MTAVVGLRHPVSERGQEPPWVVSWAASTGGATGTFAGPQATIRQRMRLAVGGGSVRLRLANPHGYAPIVLDAVTIGPGSPTADAGLSAPPAAVRFGGETRLLVHPGQTVISDPVPMPVADRSEVVVSIFSDAAIEVSSHAWANRFAWSTLSAVGNRAADTGDGAFRPWAMSWSWVDAIDVLPERPITAVVAIGDSITDGAGSDFATDTRWTDILADRFAALPLDDLRRRSVVNAGIGGNTVGGFGNNAVGVNILSRLERDALSLSGVSAVIVAGGSNDLYLGSDARSLIADYEELARRIRERGVRPIIATIVPRRGGYLWAVPHEAERRTVNRWIRQQAAYDAVLDFDPVLDDPARPGWLRPRFDADGTHPNSAGYRALAESIDLERLSASPH